MVDISTAYFSLAKPLGCYGDGGAIFTNNDGLANKMRILLNHGQNKRYEHTCIGLNGRMDTIQAAILSVKLKYYNGSIPKRQEVTRLYTNKLQNLDIILSIVAENRTSVWAQYSIRTKIRDALQDKLQKSNIPTTVHYPKPLHLQEYFAYLQYEKGDYRVSNDSRRDYELAYG